MAEFGPSVTEAPQTPNFVTPKGGVVEPSGLEAVVSIFKGAAEIRGQQRGKQQDTFLNDFTQRQLSLVQAVDQGSTTSQFGRTKMRANLAQAINDYPGLRDELLKANSSIIGNAGIGSIVKDGTNAEIRWEKQKNAMVEQGLVVADATEGGFSQSAGNFRISAEAKRRYDAEMDTISLERATVGLGKGQIELLDAREKRAAEQLLVNTTPAMMDAFNVKAEKVLEALTKGELEEGAAVTFIEEEFADFEQSMSVPLSQTDSNTGAALMKGYREYKDILVSRAKGEFTDEATQRQLKRIVNKQKLAALGDPQISKFIAATELLGDSAIFLPARLDVMQKMSTWYNGNDEADNENPTANLFDDSPTARKALKSYTDLLQVDPKSLSEKGQEQQKEQILNIFNGIESYESFLAQDPERGIGMVTDWMSTQEFYNFRTTNSELFPDTSTASRILQANYGDEVWGMVRKEFEEAEILSPGAVTMEPTALGTTRPTKGSDVRTPVPDAVTYQSTSGGMEFIALDPTNIQARSKASQLNKKLAPVINKNVKAFAHLDGSNDYRSYWEQIDESVITGGASQEEPAGGDAGDDLTLADFKVGDAQLTSAMAEGGFVGDGDFSNAETPEEVAAAFVGFNEKEHEDVLSSFIKETFGRDLSPSQTAWCAAFVNSALGAVGQEGTGTLTAKDFLDWGVAVDTPKQGDIAVFDRGAPGSWQGHVGFYVGPSDTPGHVRILGGNQDNKVSIKDTPTDRLIEFRRGV